MRLVAPLLKTFPLADDVSCLCGFCSDGKMDVTTPRKGKAPKKAEGQDLSKFGFKAEPASSSSPPSKRAAKVPPNFDHPKRGSK